uniref:Transposase n=1 Tax=Vibrio coralliilyticus TaxID=190893 RepID=M1FW48_9VIBR|nr:Transposase [Vibrio coralliilyticus]
MLLMHNSSRRHHIRKMKFKVTNWSEYEAGLCQRGSLTLWMTPEALSSWQAPKRTTRGGQPRYSDLAIETALMLGLVFGLRLRQTEGLRTSVLKLTGLGLAVPDHSTLSRRAVKPRTPNKLPGDRIPENGPMHVLIDSTGLQIHGAGQWPEEKHGAKFRKGWRKLHLALDADSGDIVAHVMTDQDAGDDSQVAPRQDQIDTPIGQFTADGAYDGEPTYSAVTDHSPEAAVINPPRANAVDRNDNSPSSHRARHIAPISAELVIRFHYLIKSNRLTFVPEDYPSRPEGPGTENRQPGKSTQGFESLILLNSLFVGRNIYIITGWSSCQLVGLITRRSQVQVLSPQYIALYAIENSNKGLVVKGLTCLPVTQKIAGSIPVETVLTEYKAR